MKLSPYTMFYRKLYELVLSRLDAICSRLVGHQWKEFERLVWNLFLYLFVHQTERLFRSRDLDQILLSCIFYAAHSHAFLAEQRPSQFTWSRLIQAYRTIPNARPKILRSVFIRCEPSSDCAPNRAESSSPSLIGSVSCSTMAVDNPCLTPSKPAGTIHLIDGQWMGDITSFYREIFLTTENLQSNLSSYFQTNPLIDFPRGKVFSRPANEHLAIHVDSNTTINYSSCQVNRNLFSSTNEENQLPKSDAHHKTLPSNILSSAIPAGRFARLVLRSSIFLLCQVRTTPFKQREHERSTASSSPRFPRSPQSIHRRTRRRRISRRSPTRKPSFSVNHRRILN